MFTEIWGFTCSFLVWVGLPPFLTQPASCYEGDFRISQKLEELNVSGD